MSEHSAESDAARCTACGGPLRVERALMTCDTDGCPGNLRTRLGWGQAHVTWPPSVYVTTAWDEVYATIEDAKAGCDEYLSKCYSDAKPHVEDGTDEAGWFQFGEYPALREWRRYFTDRDHANLMHFGPQVIRERVLRGDLTRLTSPGGGRT